MTDELKETMTKQIEHFNPLEPLFLLVDYFRVRFPITDALAVIRDVLQLKPDYMFFLVWNNYHKIINIGIKGCIMRIMEMINYEKHLYCGSRGKTRI